MLTADARGRTCPVPLHLIDGHGLISICQEYDIPALGTRKRRSRTGQCSDLALLTNSRHHRASAYRLAARSRRHDLQSLNEMPLACLVDGTLAPCRIYVCGGRGDRSDVSVQILQLWRTPPGLQVVANAADRSPSAPVAPCS
jgi:hypothetical protein